MAKDRRQQRREPADTVSPATTSRITSVKDHARYPIETPDLSLLVWKYFEEEIREALAEVIESLEQGNSNLIADNGAETNGKIEKNTQH